MRSSAKIRAGDQRTGGATFKGLSKGQREAGQKCEKL